MLVPEQLFSSPLIKDLKTQRLEIVNRQAIVTGIALADSSIATLYTVPEDRVGVVTGYGLHYEHGGSTVRIRGMVMYLVRDNSAFVVHGFQTGNDTPSTVVHYGTTCQTWVPPGFTIQLSTGLLIAGDPAMTLTYGINLLTFPRGNVSLG